LLNPLRSGRKGNCQRRRDLRPEFACHFGKPGLSQQGGDTFVAIEETDLVGQGGHSAFDGRGGTSLTTVRWLPKGIC
jgi:hypothetical protein